MDKTGKQFKDILIRYAILILSALPNLYLFYFVFTFLTIYPVYFLISLFFEPSLMGNIILVNKIPIEIIPACISGSAYYLLFILNLSTPNIRIKKRIKMIFLAFASLLILNILRIFLLSMMLITGSVWFGITHMFFWYVLSVVFVLGIWFLEVKFFRIKQIPFYSDLKFIYKNSSLKKSKSSKSANKN
ncbi:pacearchaeosortase [Candidatus Pacearchaeota archaeon]|nr:pacearchaeosortase [Candidatus Pacearchaeota archaeon]